MQKYNYIFNCSGTFDLMLGLKIFTEVQAMIPEIVFNKYICAFKDADGKWYSRSGGVKNITANFSKYLLQFDQTTRVSRIQVYVQSESVESRTVCCVEISAGSSTFNISIVGTNRLSEHQIVNIWSKINSIVSMNHMVCFPLDSSKINMFTVHGRECYPAFLNLEEQKQYYSKSEKEMIALIYDLQQKGTCNLKRVFPLCIAAENAIVDERGYASKKKIDSKTYLFSKYTKPKQPVLKRIFDKLFRKGQV